MRHLCFYSLELVFMGFQPISAFLDWLRTFLKCVPCLSYRLNERCVILRGAAFCLLIRRCAKMGPQWVQIAKSVHVKILWMSHFSRSPLHHSAPWRPMNCFTTWQEKVWQPSTSSHGSPVCTSPAWWPCKSYSATTQTTAWRRSI